MSLKAAARLRLRAIDDERDRLMHEFPDLRAIDPHETPPVAGHYARRAESSRARRRSE